MVEKRKTVRVTTLAAMKKAGERIVALTAYDALFARILDEAGVDIILVGDSVNTVLGGASSTISATLDQMIYHGRIVRSGVDRALLVVDMPFMTYQVSIEEAKRNAGRIMQETGASVVKLEGGAPVTETVRALVDVGIPVMGHLGFTPQSEHQLGGPRVQGRDPRDAERLTEDAHALAEAGACAVVLELVPTPVAEAVSQAVSIPTIGIGSGPGCDGQVLVLHDMLGLNPGFEPRFLKKYGDLAAQAREAIVRYAEEVRDGSYPDEDHSFPA